MPVTSDYTLIFYIHGDGDYLFHSASGERVQADSHALTKALSVAKQASSGNVIIFHRQENRNFLGLFPRRTSRMYEFVRGEKTSEWSYRSDGNLSRFMEEEINLYRQHPESSSDANQSVYFLYFGHEIPNHSESGYHQSLPERKIGTSTFAEEIRSFLPSERDSFDLVVLSTCSNGTPAMAENLQPFTRTLLASPQNLHLSHLDVSELSRLELNPQSKPNVLAQAIANDSFDRLSEEVHTTVTLSVYDIENLPASLPKFSEQVRAYEADNEINHQRDNIDCGDIPHLYKKEYSKGVTTFFNPARFGSRAGKESHSGWGCKPKID